MANKAKKYVVSVMEVHNNIITVIAENQEDAIKKAGAAILEGDEGYLEYSYTLGEDTWIVEEE